MQALAAGNGGALGNLNAAQLTGMVPAAALPASLVALNSGNGVGLTNVPTSALPAAVQALAAGNGGALGNLNAAQLAGVVLHAELPCFADQGNVFSGAVGVNPAQQRLEPRVHDGLIHGRPRGPQRPRLSGARGRIGFRGRLAGARHGSL